jgi:hypothetical protein
VSAVEALIRRKSKERVRRPTKDVINISEYVRKHSFTRVEQRACFRVDYFYRSLLGGHGDQVVLPRFRA